MAVFQDPNRQPDNSPTVLLRCPTCKDTTPHKTVGVQREAEDSGWKGQKTQGMKCVICGTVTKPATGEEGEEFQKNLDADDGSESETEPN